MSRKTQNQSKGTSQKGNSSKLPNSQQKPSQKLTIGAKLDYTVLFILNFAGMVLELVASRLMSPYFGNSNFVWTAIIGIILLAGSLGNIFGGKLASLKHHRYIMTLLLALTAIYLAVTPLIDVPVLSGIADQNYGVQFSAVIGSIIFFLIPATILGNITPLIMKEYIPTSHDSGKESGRITAIIAIGSLLGTFAGGFWLIPAIGTRMIFVVLACVVIFSALLYRPFEGNLKNKKLIALSVLLFILSIVVTASAGIVVARNDSTASTETGISIDTEYGRIIIEDGEYDGAPVRFYKQSGAYSSASFIDEERKYNLVFNYLKKYDDMFKFLDVKKTAMIGGAAYQYPKYFISTFKDKTMDVIEIDPMSTEIAKNYFYLDDLIDDYGSDRIGLYNDDGRVFMGNTEKKYDAILNDAFSGEVPVGTLATVEAIEAIKSRLSYNGVYMSNVLGSITGRNSKFVKSEIKTMKQVFRFVYVVPVHRAAKINQFTNWMIIATDNSTYRPDTVVDVEITDDDIILTDDYCPIDALVSTGYHD